MQAGSRSQQAQGRRRVPGTCDSKKTFLELTGGILQPEKMPECLLDVGNSAEEVAPGLTPLVGLGVPSEREQFHAHCLRQGHGGIEDTHETTP